jgi:hypothetical protein
VALYFRDFGGDRELLTTDDLDVLTTQAWDAEAATLAEAPPDKLWRVLAYQYEIVARRITQVGIFVADKRPISDRPDVQKGFVESADEMNRLARELGEAETLRD